jgi:hypothetical protein
VCSDMLTAGETFSLCNLVNKELKILLHIPCLEGTATVLALFTARWLPMVPQQLLQRFCTY